MAGFDVPQNLSLSWVYELPFGKGKRYSPSNALLNGVVGNWILNGIFTARSGQPFNINATGDIANTGNVQERANIYCANPYGNQGRNGYLNTACFSNPFPFTFGTEGRNDLRSPSVSNLDLSIFKDFPIPWREAMKLQFRSDFFNSLNQSPLGVPDINLTDANFGRILSTATAEREIQFALKLYF